jgi:hypothetical protein
MSYDYNKCRDLLTNKLGVDYTTVGWAKKNKGDATCFPTDRQMGGFTYSNSCGCASAPSQSDYGCPDCDDYSKGAAVCQATASSCSGTRSVGSQRLQARENYAPCCRPQPYVAMDQTWAPQSKFQL